LMLCAFSIFIGLLVLLLAITARELTSTP
jgi:hypothetical protein